MLLPFPPDCEGLHLSLSVTSIFASVRLTRSVCPMSLVSLFIHPKVTLPFFHPQCFLPPPLEQSADIYSTVQMAGNLAWGHYES